MNFYHFGNQPNIECKSQIYENSPFQFTVNQYRNTFSHFEVSNLLKFLLFSSCCFLSYCLKASEQQWGGSLFLTTKSPGVPGTHLIDLRRIKGWINLAATLWNKEIHCLYNIQKMHFLSLFLKMSHINLIMSVSYHICCNFTCLFSTFTDLIF